jgi:hypothetical protein
VKKLSHLSSLILTFLNRSFQFPIVKFGDWSFEKWSHSENGRILAVPRIGRSEIGRSENGRSKIGRSENGRSENGRCTDFF